MTLRSAASPLILFYTGYFRSEVDLGAMPAGIEARWTTDRSRIAEADAVVFHAPNQREFGDARKYPGQLWVLWSMESAENYPAMRDPALLRHFDLRMTYETDADIWAPYVPRRTWWDEAKSREIPARTSDAPVVMFQSSSFNRSGREDFALELVRHIRVDSYGRFMKNRSLDGPDQGVRTKLDTIARYPFCIAFENSIGPDYVTEKLFDPLGVGAVPVYLGAPNAKAFAPPNSFIDASAFSGPKDLADYLRHLLRNPAEYDAYLEWRKKPFTAEFERLLDPAGTDAFASLAGVVAQKRPARRPAGRAAIEFGLREYLRTRLRRWRAG